MPPLKEIFEEFDKSVARAELEEKVFPLLRANFHGSVTVPLCALYLKWGYYNFPKCIALTKKEEQEIINCNLYQYYTLTW